MKRTKSLERFFYALDYEKKNKEQLDKETTSGVYISYVHI